MTWNVWWRHCQLGCMSDAGQCAQANPATSVLAGIGWETWCDHPNSSRFPSHRGGGGVGGLLARAALFWGGRWRWRVKPVGELTCGLRGGPELWDWGKESSWKMVVYSYKQD